LRRTRYKKITRASQVGEIRQESERERERKRYFVYVRRFKMERDPSARI